MALPVRRRDSAPGEGQTDGERMWVPLVDIEEAEDSRIVEAELPGARPGDVNVEIQDNELSAQS